MTVYTPEYTDSLGALMESVLESVSAVFEAAQIDLPVRRYITFGETTHDCEQLTVAFQQAYVGPPGDEATLPQPCQGPRTAVLAVELVRCVPTGAQTRTGASLPSEQDLAIYGASRARDAYMLLEAGATAADQWGLGVIADVSPGQPQGGYQGIIMNLTLAIP